MWLEQTGELWLIFQITGSGTALGWHAVLRFGATVVLGLYGGVISDRVDRRKLLIGTQALQMLEAAILTISAWRGTATLTVIYEVVLANGLVHSIDNALRRSIVRDLADDAQLANAVSLNSVIGTVARTIGPCPGRSVDRHSRDRMVLHDQHAQLPDRPGLPSED